MKAQIGSVWGGITVFSFESVWCSTLWWFGHYFMSIIKKTSNKMLNTKSERRRREKKKWHVCSDCMQLMWTWQCFVHTWDLHPLSGDTIHFSENLLRFLAARKKMNAWTCSHSWKVLAHRYNRRSDGPCRWSQWAEHLSTWLEVLPLTWQRFRCPPWHHRWAET